MGKHCAAKKPMSFLALQVLLVSALFLLPVAECLSSQGGGGGANLTVTGTVFCDACSSSSFSNHSYFLPGVRVRIDCTFRASSTSNKEEIKITAEKTTDSYGAYQLDIPAIDGVGCTTTTTGVETAAASFCRAAALDNPSALCNVPALTTTAGHISFSTQAQQPNSNANVCLYNLNSLYYRPRPNKGGPGLCSDGGGPLQQPAALNDSLFYCPRWPWPPIPFCTPRPWFPPIPFFTPPPPPAFPFPLPPFPPFPFFTPPSPPPPPFPFNLPPWPWTPPAPAQAPPTFPFPRLPPIFSAPSPPPPPPPAFPFPFPFPNLPPFPHLPPFAFPPLPSFYSPPPPPPPPPPSFHWPFPPLPFFPPTTSPSAPSPPPLKRSRKDPTTWSSSKTTP